MPNITLEISSLKTKIDQINSQLQEIKDLENAQQANIFHQDLIKAVKDMIAFMHTSLIKNKGRAASFSYQNNISPEDLQRYQLHETLLQQINLYLFDYKTYLETGDKKLLATLDECAGKLNTTTSQIEPLYTFNDENAKIGQDSNFIAAAAKIALATALTVIALLFPPTIIGTILMIGFSLEAAALYALAYRDINTNNTITSHGETLSNKAHHLQKNIHNSNAFFKQPPPPKEKEKEYNHSYNYLYAMHY